MQSDLSPPRPLRDSPVFLMIVGALLTALAVAGGVLLWNFASSSDEEAAAPAFVSVAGKIEPRDWKIAGLARDDVEFARIVATVTPPMPHDMALVYAPKAAMTRMEMPALRAPSDVLFVAGGKVTASVVNMPPGRVMTINFVDANGLFSVDHVVVFAAGLSQVIGVERGRAVSFAGVVKTSS